MGLPLEKPGYVTPEAYLEVEMATDTRNEYLNGEVFAMVGTSSMHNVIVLNIAQVLRNQLRGGPCQVFAIDLKLRVESANAYFYPDLMVTCSETDRKNDYVKAEPTLVVEVLSPSTAGFDRDKKFACYRQLPSLKEYLLIDAECRNVECYRRGEGVEWILHPYREGETVTLHGLNLTLPVEAIYQDVEFPAEQ